MTSRQHRLQCVTLLVGALIALSRWCDGSPSRGLDEITLYLSTGVAHSKIASLNQRLVTAGFSTLSTTRMTVGFGTEFQSDDGAFYAALTAGSRGTHGRSGTMTLSDLTVALGGSWTALRVAGFDAGPALGLLSRESTFTDCSSSPSFCHSRRITFGLEPAIRLRNHVGGPIGLLQGIDIGYQWEATNASWIDGPLRGRSSGDDSGGTFFRFVLGIYVPPRER